LSEILDITHQREATSYFTETQYNLKYLTLTRSTSRAHTFVQASLVRSPYLNVFQKLTNAFCLDYRAHCQVLHTWSPHTQPAFQSSSVCLQ